MKIKPLGAKIQLGIEKPKVGDLDISAVNVAKEKGKVLAIGKDVTLPIKVGDIILFKAWAVDIINDDGETYYFIDQDSKGLCAII